MVITRKKLMKRNSLGQDKKKLKFRCSNYTEKFGVKFFSGLKIAVVFFSKLAEKCTTFSTLLLPIDNFLHKKVFFRSSPGVELQGNYVGMFDLHVYWYTITMAGLFLVVQTRTQYVFYTHCSKSLIFYFRKNQF